MRWPTVEEFLVGTALVLALAIALVDVMSGPWGGAAR